jgi:hypothetical protein
MAKGHGSKGRRQEQAIAGLLSEATVEQAARKAGVGYRTLKGWLGQDQFQRAYRDARRALLEHATGLLADGLTAAVVRLRHLSENAASENVQLGATRAVLELTLKVREQLELDERLRAVEARLAALGEGRKT